MYIDAEFILLKIINEYLVVLYVLAGVYTIYRLRRNRLLDAGILLITSIGIAELLKSILKFPRPTPIRSDIVFSDSGMPSTHTTVAFAVLFMVYIFLHEKHHQSKYFKVMMIIYFIFAVFIALLRILSHAHSIYDVLGGITVALIVSLVFKYYDISGRRV